jgi:ABC-type bacteriocin/lantibiotic exporter with double-glycine peptidase domain
VSYVLAATARRQLPLILLSLLVIPATWFLLDIPKHIINHTLTDSDGHNTMTFAGLHLDRLPLLAALCASYLAMLTASTLLKYAVGQIRGRINERLVRRLRLQIVRRASASRSPSEKAALAAVAVQEVEPIGYFGASLLVVPLIQGGTLCASVVFLLVQNPALALAALMMLPLQLTLLPRLQRTINGKVRERVYATRELTSLLASASMAPGLRQSGAPTEPISPVRRQARQVRILEALRIQISDQKGRLKGLYNYTSNLTPFFFFAIGGYLVVQGRLSLGALVAALAAYREIVPALKELFDFAQSWSDAHARFEEVTKVLGRAAGGTPRAQCSDRSDPAMLAARSLQHGGAT